MSSTVNVILLAGDRGPDDPLASHAGVPGKVLVPVAGQAMLTRVLVTLVGWPRLGRVVLLAPAQADYRDAALASGIESDRLIWVPPAQSPSASVQAGLEAAGSDRPVFLLTADHPLLDSAWLDGLLSAGDTADLLVGLADWTTVMARFPRGRRTRYRFRDRSICGTNLFLFRTPEADRMLEVWKQVEASRKKPWKVVALLGWGNLARYLSGRLRVGEAFAALSARLGFVVSPTIVDDPLAAVDVDSVADLELVSEVLEARGRVCG